MSKLWRGSIVFVVVSILILVGFFLPWLSVSSDEQIIQTYNGYRMARGEPEAFARIDFDGYSIHQYTGSPYFSLLFALPGAAALVLLFACVAAVRHRIGLLTSAAWGFLGTSGLVFLILGLKGIWSSYMGSVSFCSYYGLWVTTAGLVVTVIGALLTLPGNGFFRRAVE